MSTDVGMTLKALAIADTLGKIAAEVESYELGMIDAETFAARVGDLVVSLNRRWPLTEWA